MKRTNGFSLAELLIALTISAGLSMMMFQLFHQNERVIRDQTIVMEMQQTARIVISQIADELRMAGQGVPVYASSLDVAPSEAIAVFLDSSGANRIDFRAGLSKVVTGVANTPPLDFAINVSRPISVVDSSGFAPGKFLFIFDQFTWLRCAVTSVSSGALFVTARETGRADTTIRFSRKPTVALDEAVSIHLSSGSVRRATSNDMTNPARPTWSAANEIGKNVTSLTFTYYDRSAIPITPNSLSSRLSIARVDIALSVQASAVLSDGTRPSHSLALRTIPRNVRIRWPQ
jgi:prepilin-type N-terminal cleavage/methylation domain-containing protein